MNKGQGLTAMAAELERQRELKKDYIAPTEKMNFAVEQERGRYATAGEVVLDGINGAALGLKPLAHQQLAGYAGIPKGYYDRMKESAPQLLADSLNTWVHEKNEHRMIRTLDGDVRAVLSPSYRIMDSYELAEAVLPIISGLQAETQSAQLTETRMYIKAVTSRLSAEIRKGDTVQAGVVISNSELGAGSLNIETMTYRLICLNGAIAGTVLRKFHLGRRAELSNDAYEMLSDGTKRLDDAAFWSKIRDLTSAALSDSAFRKVVDGLRAATELKIESDDVAKVVERTVEVLALPLGTTKGILSNLARGADFTAYGLSQAITAVANEWPNYEEVVSLERAGGQVIELPQSDWKRIAEAA